MPERSRWIDPAPLEVARPRLPWWTHSPRWALVLVAPLIAVGLAVWLTVVVARKAARYPLAFAVVLVLVVAWHGWGWPVALILGAILALVLVGWWWRFRPSFVRLVLVEIRSEWRRLIVYTPVWLRTMRFCHLERTVNGKVHVPTFIRVRADGWRDRVTVKLLHGQTPGEFETRAEALAHSFDARTCRVRVVGPRRIVLDLIHGDPLTQPVPPPSLPDGTDDTTPTKDLERVPVGTTETGRPWLLRLFGSHLLAVGATGAGKASVVWSLLWSLAPMLRSGLIRVYGIDPKGGMELGKAPELFHRLVFDNGLAAVKLLEELATEVKQRAASFRGSKRRWSVDCGVPFLLLVVDELADVVAYQTDRKLKERANSALQTITSQGRAPGVCVIGEIQDPRKEILSFRHLFPTRIALRLDEPGQVDMVLGDGVRERGAVAHEISETTPGVAWVKYTDRREPVRARAFHITDGDLDRLVDYVTADATDSATVHELPARTVDADPDADDVVGEAA
ncbi:FtsK/SpoIIIE domain-containing protein [Actinoalloteichus hymeniacidonis]|uniref:FtsK/SpoIIIE family protein n=1 Tax=Actinoalloteichus hymeniacidonis TaxID=340345 RepID=A0AAC9HKT9_9PSEU|nr:FtsK/SpoIIIE domain-containing protein [Actinoalloteichus hymeniacidonis]AOS61148.1 FtsK/SpoIIIE family protein [Actinoalloteichus hymeniacidonis]MBB5910851.1 S-DNA-T family DNA segregation ATPase FtsK/SpoIIIE [Actinoalloteichus hymeniacidonis]